MVFDDSHWMVMKEGLCQGGMAAGAAVIVQTILSTGRQESFFNIFAVTDAGVVTACVYRHGVSHFYKCHAGVLYRERL